MTPLLACIPVVMMFVALALLALLVIATGMVNELPEDERKPAPAGPPPGTVGPPPWWVVALMFVALAALMLVLSRIWPE